MGKSINKVILVGRLGRDPEMKYTASGTPFCRFSIATDEGWTDKASGEKTEKTEWHNIVVWGKQAEIAGQYLKKGKQIFLNSNPQCSLCHTVGASGGKFGPDLSAIGKKRDAVWLAKYLPNPRFLDPANKMPAVTAKGKDLEDLIAYLVSLKGK